MMKRLSIGVCMVVAALCTSSGVLVRAQQPTAPEIGWLGLFNGALVEWLENENQLTRLCAQFAVESEGWYRCRAETLAPKIHVVRLWAAPSETSTLVGSLLIVATPGQGLRSLFVGAGGGPAIEFHVDLFDGDWGYGPYFHETFVERRAQWFRLPETPFPRGTWLNAADLGGQPELHVLEAEQIVTSPFGDLRILAVEREGLRARLEQDADMWCGSGEPPPLKPWQEIRIPLRDLYTATGHLRLHKKYTRGC